MARIPGIIGRKLELSTGERAEVLECPPARAAAACPRLFQVSATCPPPFPGCWVVIAPEGGEPFPAVFICGLFLAEGIAAEGITAFSATEIYERRFMGFDDLSRPRLENVFSSGLVMGRFGQQTTRWSLFTASLGPILAPRPSDLPEAYKALLEAPERLAALAI